MKFLNQTAQTDWKLFAIVTIVAVILVVGGVLLLKTMQPAISPMEEVTLQPCDVNSDGECNEKDHLLFRQALGSTRGETNYNPLADADGDGAITDVDQRMLFPTSIPKDEFIGTSTWQTYRNDEFGFEVRYPRDWFNVTLEDRNREIEEKIYEFSNQKDNFAFEKRILIQIIVSNNQSQKEIFQSLRSLKQNETIERDLVKYTKIADGTIGGLPAVRYQADRSAIPYIGLPDGIEILLQKDEAIFQFLLILGSGDLDFVKQAEMVVNEILSTFRFVE